MHCALCLRGLPAIDEVRSTAVVTAAMDRLGNRLDVPGTYPLCRDCRQQVAVAEKASIKLHQ